VQRTRSGAAGGVADLGALVGRLVDRPPLSGRSPGKLRWDDPELSERMLREHLDQTHDRASRRSVTIDAHVDWIVRHLLAGGSGRVVDLGCGPGLYTRRLAELGCTCLGVDISPASIRHARGIASDLDLDCTYVLGDVRTADLGSGHDLAMMLFGELNTFTPDDAALLVRRAASCLRPGGSLLLEVHTFDSVVEEGTRSAGWYTAIDGLFAARPHLVLSEHAWDDSSATAATRILVVDDTGRVAVHTEALHAYTVDGYRELLTDAGLAEPTVHLDAAAFADPTMIVLAARRAGRNAPPAAHGAIAKDRRPPFRASVRMRTLPGG
jgi:SAM-dependent methyltransferase